MKNLSDGLIYGGGCHSLPQFIVIAPNLIHHTAASRLNERLTDNRCRVDEL